MRKSLVVTLKYRTARSSSDAQTLGMKPALEHETHFDLPIDLMEEARNNYADRLPPFIQEMTTCSPNTLQQVDIPTESGKLPDARHRKAVTIVCRAWDSAGIHKFWTYDHAGTRYIVKGFQEGKTWDPHIAFCIWHGKKVYSRNSQSQGFGTRTHLRLSFAQAVENFSLDIDKQLLLHPIYRPSTGRATQNSIKSTMNPTSEKNTSSTKTRRERSSTLLKSPTLGPPITGDESSDDEPLLTRSRRLQQIMHRESQISLCSSDRVRLEATGSTDSGEQLRTDINSLSNASGYPVNFGTRALTGSPLSNLLSSSFTIQPLTASVGTSLTSIILNQTTLHVSLSINKFGAIPIRLSSCPNINLFYAKVATSWDIAEADIEAISVHFDWLPDFGPMVIKKEVEDSYITLLEMVEDAPCWAEKGPGRKKCSLRVILHMKVEKQRRTRQGIIDPVDGKSTDVIKVE